MTEKELERKITIESYGFDECETFNRIYADKNPNFKALSSVWTSGTKVFVVWKRGIFIRRLVGFASIIDCRVLKREEKRVKQLFDVPSQYEELFINDFRIDMFSRGKGIGSFVAKKILSEERKYLLKPEEDGIYFWPKMGFVYDSKKCYMTLDKK